MKRICYSDFHIGDRYFGDKEPFEKQDLSHGVCPQCLPLELKKVEEQLNAIQNENQTNPAAL
jgi:hypothetical protein